MITPPHPMPIRFGKSASKTTALVLTKNISKKYSLFFNACMAALNTKARELASPYAVVFWIATVVPSPHAATSAKDPRLSLPCPPARLRRRQSNDCQRFHFKVENHSHG